MGEASRSLLGWTLAGALCVVVTLGGCMPALLPGPVLRSTRTPAPGRVLLGFAVGGDAGVGQASNVGPTEVGVGDVRVSALGRIGLGHRLDLGLAVSSSGVRADLGWRLTHGPGVSLLLDPTLAGGIVAGGSCGGMDCVLGTSVAAGDATLPLLISVPLGGQARVALVPAVDVSWTAGQPLAAPGIGILRSKGWNWNPSLGLLLDLPLSRGIGILVEADGTYAPDVGAGSFGVSFGLSRR